MLRSLKAKFILAFGSLIVVLFAVLGAVLINSKTQELSQNISDDTQNFAQFTASRVVGAYHQYLEPGNFLSFNREVDALLRRNEQIDTISMVSYNGVILYDSFDEPDERYSGPLRTISDTTDIDRIQSRNMSLRTREGRIVYVKVDDRRNLYYMDRNEEPVDPVSGRDRIVDIIMPEGNAYAVIYGVDYRALEASLTDSRIQIGLLALAGLFLALLLSTALSVSITRPVKALKQGALKIASGDFSARVNLKSKDELGLLAGTFNKMAEDLAASTQAMLYQERVQKELELASQIQKDLLPEEKMQLKSLDIAGGLVPATEVGGDAYDYLQMSDGKVLTYLADVTGHGVAAGIVSSIANAMLYGMRHATDLKSIVKQLNDVLIKKTSQKVFMTMALTLWDPARGVLSYLNAGHPPVLYYDAALKKVMEVKIPGMAVGLSAQVLEVVSVKDILMKPNDVLVMYSDGIPEAVNGKKVQYGLQRLKRIVQDAANDLYTAEGIKNAVLSDVVEFMGQNRSHLDDMTVLVLKRKEAQAALPKSPAPETGGTSR